VTTDATENRILAQAAGSYRERPVHGALQDHFACIWVHRLPRPDTQPMVIVPDGCIDLEWIDGTLRIAGPDRVPKIERLAAGLYCGPVLRHLAGPIQAANFRSAIAF
jgi:hypothetical protein